MRAAARSSIIITALLLAYPAAAAVLVPLTLEDMVGQADAVVLGEAVRTNSFWGPEHKRIYTEVTFRIERILKGSPDVTEVTVRRLGGTVGDVGMKVPGNGKLEIGARHLLFLRQHTMARRFAVLGMAQGIYHVRPPERTGEPELAVRDLAGAALAGTGPRQIAPDRLALPELLTRIQTLLTGKEDR